MNAQLKLLEAQRQRCEVSTRVMGYHPPVTVFKLGTQSEHRELQHFV
ncbi:oxidoreductase [Pseudomonas sp. UBA6323]|nr:oxidoreductase [Pseudomonas sp. UBA6323]